MRNLIFKRIKASNFLCFGDQGIEINLEQLNDIILIKVLNYLNRK